jgi:site-specific recombinase
LTRRVVDQMLEALLVVSHRVSALGLEPELVRNHPELMERESPFIAQSVEATRFVNAYPRALDAPPDFALALWVALRARRGIQAHRRAAPPALARARWTAGALLPAAARNVRGACLTR